MSITSACVAAASAAALVAGAAFADHHEGVQLNGVYQTVNGDVTMAFGADGQMDGDSPTGIRVRDTFVIEDNVFTITAPDDHPMCPSAVGVFELAEQHPQKRGLARTVGADDPDPLALGQPQGEVFDQPTVAQGESEVLHLEHGGPGPRSGHGQLGGVLALGRQLIDGGLGPLHPRLLLCRARLGLAP